MSKAGQELGLFHIKKKSFVYFRYTNIYRISFEEIGQPIFFNSKKSSIFANSILKQNKRM